MTGNESPALTQPADLGVDRAIKGLRLSTARQIHLLGLLGQPVPAYAHLPVASNSAGEKLSKQTLARAVDGGDPARVLVDALDFLGQQPPVGLADAGLAAVWAWARQRWSMARVPRWRAVPAPRYG